MIKPRQAAAAAAEVTVPDPGATPAGIVGPAAERTSPLLARLFRNPRGYLVRQWPLIVVVACFLVGLTLILVSHWRRGAMVLGGATGLAGLFRVVLPEDRVGLLAVRSRLFDVAITGLAGAAMIVLALVVPASA